MKVSGSYTFDAAREDVWAALNDIDVLARIVPGCERLEQPGENEFTGIVKIGIQSIRGTYQGRIRLEDVQYPHHYRLIANGKSANAVVDGVGTIDLVEENGKTTLTYGGILASVGQRLIEGAARQLINQSLKALTEQVAIRTGKVAAPVAAEAPAAPAAPVAEAPPRAALNGADAPSGIAEPAPTAAAVPTDAPRRTVVVPPEEQLKPESVAIGIVKDFVVANPWVAIAVAFVIGYIFGRSGK
ncbi:MAG TPA: carbon monoxide dehydrogenase subunit G [Roseiflexaceae bacterium]|nr:carbon monoxide dehydrogenase subunit G [Roseiflexaceae bacterium]